jgi:hypothetical protein
MSWKTVYLFDPATFAFAGTYQAQESPLELGVFIEPVHSTDIEPPAVDADQVAVWNGAWSVQPDYRGQTMYDQTSGAPLEVTSIGAIPAGFALTPPPPTLAQALATKTAELQSDYVAAINAPVSFKNAAGVTSTYPSGNTVQINGQTAKQNLEDALTAGSAAWTLNAWLDTNGVAQTFTFADLQGLAAAMEAVVTVDWKDLVAKIAAAQAATTVAAIQAITF